MDGDRENLLDTELLPAEDFPPDFPTSLRNLDTDPALRIQRLVLGDVFDKYPQQLSIFSLTILRKSRINTLLSWQQDKC